MHLETNIKTYIVKRPITFLKVVLFLSILLKVSFSYSQDSVSIINSDSTTFNFKLNEPFVLRFEACTSCGYDWFMEPVDTTRVKLLCRTSKHTSGRTDIAGGNVYEFCKFIGLSRGTYSLEFYYKRPWLKENEKVYRVKLLIN